MDESTEKLIRETSATTALLNRFIAEWDDMKNTLATKSDVSAVSDKLAEHVKNHENNRSMVALWVSIIGTYAFSAWQAFKGDA